ELALAGLDDRVGAAQPARGCRTGLQQITPDGAQIEHRVEGRDLADADRRHLEDLCDMIHRRPGQPSAALLLGNPQQRQNRACLTAGGICGDGCFSPLQIFWRELEVFGLLDPNRCNRGVHRSISPKTISIEPMIATESASMWPRHMKSVACKNAKPGDLILQR